MKRVRQISGGRETAAFRSTAAATAFLALLVGAAGAAEPDFSFRAYVDRTEITVTEPVQLTLEVSGGDLSGVGDIPVPRLTNLEAASSSSSTSRNISLVNGRMTSTVTRSTVYLLMPVKPGPAAIGAAALERKGKTYRTAPINIRVVDSGAGSAPGSPPPPSGSPAPGAAGRPLFLAAQASKSRAYLNEPIVVDFHLYTQAQVEAVEVEELPATAGFLADPQPPPASYRGFRRTIDGRDYTGALIRQMVLYPKLAGTQTVGPMSLSCRVRVRGRDPFFSDWFGGSLFGQTVVRTLQSEPLPIEVLDLPATGRPPGFQGDVGRYTLSASAGIDQVTAGAPVTLTVEIKGEGNLKSLSAPELNLPPDFRVYDPEVELSTSLTGGTVAGSKKLSYLVVPSEPGEYRLGPIRLPYFDTGAGGYRLAEASAGLLRVLPGAGGPETAEASGPERRRVRLLKQEISYIKEPNRALRTNAPPWDSWIFWAILILPLGSFLTSTVYRRHRTRLAEDVAYARDRRAYNSARKALRQAREMLKSDRPGEFHAALARAVTEFVGDKFNRPAPGLSSEEIGRLLAGRGVPADVRRELASFLNSLALARFAAVQPTGPEMADRLKQAEKLLTGLARRL